MVYLFWGKFIYCYEFWKLNPEFIELKFLIKDYELDEVFPKPNKKDDAIA